MLLSKLFDQRHFQSFDPGASKQDNDSFVRRVLHMIKQSGIEVTHRVTDEGMEFGFTDPHHADMLRLNLIALEGDFGAHTHTQYFDSTADREDWMALATEVATALGIDFEGFYFDDRLELDFERSEDALILKAAMERAWDEGALQGIAQGRGMQHRMTALKADLSSPRQGF